VLKKGERRLIYIFTSVVSVAIQLGCRKEQFPVLRNSIRGYSKKEERKAVFVFTSLVRVLIQLQQLQNSYQAVFRIL
jgi:hypothetical protein